MAVRGQGQPVIDQPLDTEALRQRRGRQQPRRRHEIRLVEPHTHPGRIVRCSDPSDALSARGICDLNNRIVPGRRAFDLYGAPLLTTSRGASGLRDTGRHPPNCQVESITFVAVHRSPVRHFTCGFEPQTCAYNPGHVNCNRNCIQKSTSLASPSRTPEGWMTTVTGRPEKIRDNEEDSGQWVLTHGGGSATLRLTE
jgi:hypothetical protein